jgi:hypothetical protein
MKRFVKWLIGIVIALAIVFIGGAYVLPGEAVVQRQVTINAPPERVFAIVGDLRRFNEFSPWAEMDRDAKYAYSGPDRGVGQKMSWESAKLGSGSQTITGYVENRRVASDLDFGAMGKAQASFELAPVGTNTGVTWGFKTVLANPLERWMGLLYDRWIGADYAKGLAKLKLIAEREAATQ